MKTEHLPKPPCSNCADAYSGVCTGGCRPYTSAWTLGVRPVEKPAWKIRAERQRRFLNRK